MGTQMQYIIYKYVLYLHKMTVFIGLLWKLFIMKPHFPITMTLECRIEFPDLQVILIVSRSGSPWGLLCLYIRRLSVGVWQVDLVENEGTKLAKTRGHVELPWSLHWIDLYRGSSRTILEFIGPSFYRLFCFFPQDSSCEHHNVSWYHRLTPWV